MCIIALAHRASARHRLIVAANRDESHARPTLAAGWWPDAPDVLGGRDVEAGGTWLAIRRDLRLAAVTNFREEAAAASAAFRSRGHLVNAYLSNESPAADYAWSAAAAGREFGPFNLVVFDGEALHYTSNRARPRVLESGVHAFSNAEPEAGWPKVARAREAVAELLDDPDPTEALFALLAERAPPAGGFDDRQVSLFQRHPVWGTRSSTVILVDYGGRVRFAERSFDPSGAPVGQVDFEFSAAAA